jgi:transposase
MTTQAKAKYSAEFKENAVKRATESSNVAETARELGIKENTLYNWVYQHSRADQAARNDAPLYDELKRLKKENARLMEERDLWTKPRRTLPEKVGEVRMDSETARELCGGFVVFGDGGESERLLCVDKNHGKSARPARQGIDHKN